MQGRMRVLKDLTAFSTVTLTVNEIKGSGLLISAEY